MKKYIITEIKKPLPVEHKVVNIAELLNFVDKAPMMLPVEFTDENGKRWQIETLK